MQYSDKMAYQSNEMKTLHRICKSIITEECKKISYLADNINGQVILKWSRRY